jgi:hypothetical protein
MQSTRLVRCLPWAAAALLACSCAAQVMQDRGTMPDGRQVRFPRQGPEIPAGPPGTPQSVPDAANPAPGNSAAENTRSGTANTPSSDLTAPPASAALPPSLLDKPAQPAKIVLSGGRLAVQADNSSLSQILEAVETTSGMTVDGLGKDLSALLDGAGYNFMMVGATDSGAPREIILTQSSKMPIGNTEASSQPQPDEDDQPVVNNYPQEQPPPAPRPSSVLAPPDAAGRVRTPQEILQELERMRAQQQQQQPQ